METNIPDITQVNEEARLCLVSLCPLKLVSTLLKHPFLSPMAAYSFIEAKAAALKLTMAMQPLLIWIRGYL